MSGEDFVPFSDVKAPVSLMELHFMGAIQDVLRSGRFINGPAVEQFEKNFADFCKCSHAVGVSSGTDALRFALIASGVKAGDIVLTVPNTFVATSEAIAQAGAMPLFIDVDELTSSISPAMLHEFLEQNCFYDDLTNETVHSSSGRVVRAVVVVHLYGQMADMDAVCSIAEKFKIMVIEDACQAHGAQYYSQSKGEWLKAGSIGKAAAFSFYPSKNLGAFGDAGAVTTNEPLVAERVKMLREHGQIRKYFHELDGYNGRLDTIQAAVLNVKLNYLDEWNRQRRNRAGKYNECLQNIKNITLPMEPSWARSVYHRYVIRTPFRDMLQGYLKEQGVETGLHYPVPLHQQKVYRKLGYRTGSFPVAEKLSKEVLSLPMFPSLIESQQQRVVQSIIDFTKKVIG